MANVRLGFFIVPAEHLDDLREREAESDKALAKMSQDMYRLEILFFNHAKEVAVASAILHGDEYYRAYQFFHGWLRESFLGNEDREVVDPDELSAIISARDKISLETVRQWANAHIHRYGEVDHLLLADLFEAWASVMSSVPSGDYGFVVTAREDEPPKPPPSLPITPEDTAALGKIQDSYFARGRRREWFENWPYSKNEGRMILGVLAPEAVPELRDGYTAARNLLVHNKIVLGCERYTQAVRRAERALPEKIVETLAGTVVALTWLKIYADWDEAENPRGVVTTQQTEELRQRLDELEVKYDGAQGLIESIWKREPHWSRGIVREAYDQLRAVLDRAIAGGYGFVWMHDRFE